MAPSSWLPARCVEHGGLVPLQQALRARLSLPVIRQSVVTGLLAAQLTDHLEHVAFFCRLQRASKQVLLHYYIEMLERHPGRKDEAAIRIREQVRRIDAERAGQRLPGSLVQQTPNVGIADLYIQLMLQQPPGQQKIVAVE